MTLNLTLEQRDRLLEILPTYESKPVGRKRCDIVAVFSGIVWVLVSGARWEDIDKKRYASRQTCHRYFTQWVREGRFSESPGSACAGIAGAGAHPTAREFHRRLLRGGRVPAKWVKGASVGLTKAGKGTKVMALVDANGLPIAIRGHIAQPSEVKLAFDLVQNCWSVELPERVIGGYPLAGDSV